VTEALFDTNILIDGLKGFTAAEKELARYSRRWISRIGWIEVLAGAGDDARQVEDYLDHFQVVELSEEIARRAAFIRQQRKQINLPDAIIWATAQVSGRILITRNSKDFPASLPGIRVPYTL
jgi:hypothetical protein